MKEAIVRGAAIDVSELPSFAFGTRSAMWWATMGVVAIESTVFALCIGAYFYLRVNSDTWPPGLAPPDLLWGTVNTIVLLASVVPNHWAKRAALRYDLHTVRAAMMLCLLFAVAFLLVRVFEFRSLNCGWASNGYGSIVWLLLGLHTTHLVTDFLDSVVLAGVMIAGPLEGRRFVDVAENAMYWDFVVLAWLPIYAVIYWAPRYGS